MPECYLSTRQKDLLRSLIPGLEIGTVSTEWMVMADRGVITGIKGMEENLFSESWFSVTEADLRDFVECGFLRQVSGARFLLKAQKIIDTVNTNFGENASATPISIPKIESVFGEPSSDPQFRCDIFMVMPFRPELDNAYKVVKSVSQDLKLILKRGDDFSSRQGIIINEVWSAINACRLVIADCTAIDNQVNGNVYYEIGIADARFKPVLLITQDVNQIPFDLKHRRFVTYNHAFELQSALKTAINKMLNGSKT